MAETLVINFSFHVGLSCFLIPLTWWHFYCWAKQKGRERRRCGGTDLRGGTKRRLGVPCLLVLHQWAPGDMCPAWPSHGSRMGEGTSHRGSGRSGDRGAPQTSGTSCYSWGNLRVLGCGLMWIFKEQIAGYYLFSNTLTLSFKTFLPACNKWCGLWKTQQHISLWMQAMAITCFKTWFKILWSVVLYWPKNAKQT